MRPDRPRDANGAGPRTVLGGTTLRPDIIRRYLKLAFGEDLAPVQTALKKLAESRSVRDLHREAYPLYERFRPAVPEGADGWGRRVNST